jgi:hypothetical protein
MAVNGVSATAVAATAAGGLLVWSGIKGANITTDLRDLISGEKPDATNVNPVGTPAASSTSTFLGSPVPVQGSGLPSAGTYTHAQLVSLWQQAGGSASTANNAACHAIQESSGQPQATSSNPDGGQNVGLWQLDTKGVGAGHSVSSLMNALNNARITVFATRNGTNWSQWATPGC